VKDSFPRIRKLAKRIGIYEPLHKGFILYQLRRNRIALRVEGDRRILLTKNGRRVRVRDWDTAAIARYSFDAMYEAVTATAADGTVDYSQPAWHSLRASGETYFFTAVADLEVDDFFATYTKALSEGAVVFHVGAYCGVQTVALSRLVGTTGKVFAFEPDPESFAALQKNLERHRCSNVDAKNLGLWNSKSTLTFYSTTGMHSSFTNAPSHEKLEISVDVTAADLIADQHALTRLDLYKIDAEGAELEILKGSTKLLEKFSPKLFIDVHLHSDPLLGEKIEELLSSLQYRVQWIPFGESDSMRFCYAEKV
jgi:FkbM family methyltransferase